MTENQVTGMQLFRSSFIVLIRHEARGWCFCSVSLAAGGRQLITTYSSLGADKTSNIVIIMIIQPRSQSAIAIGNEMMTRT